ncbi:trimeric intracellular cation channel family protein [Oxalobacteraceae bacterium OM1]|nr:trimeric intracellular cation channel family protein [Oxalobacteraceae bacterium OM1]
MKTLVLVLDLAGTFVFALSGALAGVKRRLDFFGILVLSIAAANSGGIVRDVLIGAVPPAAILDWRYFATSITAGILTFFCAPAIERLRSPVLVFDALGLAMFAVAGAQKALAFGLPPGMAALLGMITGIGGGMARDVLLTEVPTVLTSDIYATAALAGAGMVVLADMLGLPSGFGAVFGAALCVGIRLLAIFHNWHLPAPHGPHAPRAQRAPRVPPPSSDIDKDG